MPHAKRFAAVLATTLTLASGCRKPSSTQVTSAEGRDLDAFISDLEVYQRISINASNVFCAVSFSKNYDQEVRRLSDELGPVLAGVDAGVMHAGMGAELMPKSFQACMASTSCRAAFDGLKTVMKVEDARAAFEVLVARTGLRRSAEAASQSAGQSALQGIAGPALKLAGDFMAAAPMVCDLAKVMAFSLDQVISEAGAVRAEIFRHEAEAHYFEVSLCKRIANIEPPLLPDGRRVRKPQFCDAYHFERLDSGQSAASFPQPSESASCPAPLTRPPTCTYQQVGQRGSGGFVQAYQDLWTSKSYSIGLAPGTPVIRMRTCHNGKEDVMQVRVRSGSLQELPFVWVKAGAVRLRDEEGQKWIPATETACF